MAKLKNDLVEDEEDDEEKNNVGIPGMDADIYIGSPEDPPPDWRKKQPKSADEEDKPQSEEEMQIVHDLIGFDPRKTKKKKKVAAGKEPENEL